MDIFLDFDNTILHDDFSISSQTIEGLSKLAFEHKIYVLTYGGLHQVRHFITDPRITIVSIMENQTDPVIDCKPMPASVTAYLMENPFVFSMHSLDNKTTRVYKYRERLRKFYPTDELVMAPAEEAYSLLFTCIKDGFQEIKEHLPNITFETLVEDEKNLFCKATLLPSTKEDFVKRYKKSPAIGIGDSLSDYAFISCCEIQVAMKNGEEELKKLCSYQTEKTNDEDGVIYFLHQYLKHQQA